ncbi:high-affinity Zn(2+) transporter zrt1 [Aphanomyces cochlioides]|nr:high-affinity Zn(2+) transporter zrt1 [Aphanomyces cochlioides]
MAATSSTALWLMATTMALISAFATAADDDSAVECGAVTKTEDAYDTSMHIAAVFIIFGVSIVGSLFPVVNTHVACLHKSRSVVALLNAFGFGVVIATACIHMIPPAIETLNNPCLNLSYEGLAMVFVVLTVLLMQVIETELVLLVSKPPATVALISTDEEDVEQGNRAVATFASVSTPTVPEVHDHHPHHSHHHAPSSGPKDSSDVRKKINVLIFEIGVAIHSVIIGLNLGVATGSSFTTLLTALCFHQFFEGVAVGSSAVSAFSSVRTAVSTAVAFSLTTPLGIVVGIGINSSYSETSTTSLWVRGTLDAIAGGILIYTGLVELLTYHYTINPEFHTKSTGLRWLNYLFLWLGAGAMAVVGYWA